MSSGTSPSSSQVKKPPQPTLTSTTPSSPLRSHASSSNSSPNQTAQVGGALLNSILQQKNAARAAKADSGIISPCKYEKLSNRFNLLLISRSYFAKSRAFSTSSIRLFWKQVKSPFQKNKEYDLQFFFVFFLFFLQDLVCAHL